jgi:hypothetical protein
MKERIELSGVYFRVQNPETKKWESVCFEDLELNQQKKVIKNKSKKFLQNLAIKMASTLWQLGDALELYKDSEELQKGHFALFVLKKGE